MRNLDRPQPKSSGPSLTREMERLRERVSPPWSEEREEAIANVLARRTATQKRRRQSAQVLLLVAAVSLLGVLGLRTVWPASRHAPPREAVVPSSSPAPLLLADGSSVTPDPGSEVRWRDVGPTLVSASLERGRARFDVNHVATRVFRVEAGPVAIQVLGTDFTVERTSDLLTRVSVERGRVRVFWNGGSRDLAAGEDGLFPPPESAPSVPTGTPAPTDAAAVAESAAPDHEAQRSPAKTWRNLAQGGAFDQAYTALRGEGGSVAVSDNVNDLLLAADVARLSHHPDEAVEPLRQIVRLHEGDPRASLAAFTLGRVLLESLGRPREAADAFARVRQLAPGGELSGDALAREVEARAGAGDTDAARALAEQYLRDFPTGARARSVRRYGGLE
jgi:transmembrane sensor